MRFEARALPSALCLAALLMLADSGRAQDAQLLRDRSLAATCAQCHGTEGRAVAGTGLPGLAGLPAPSLAEQMKSFKSGARAGTVMPQLAKGFSDAQIDTLARWFAQQAAAAATP